MTAIQWREWNIEKVSLRYWAGDAENIGHSFNIVAYPDNRFLLTHLYMKDGTLAQDQTFRNSVDEAKAVAQAYVDNLAHPADQRPHVPPHNLR